MMDHPAETELLEAAFAAHAREHCRCGAETEYTGEEPWVDAGLKEWRERHVNVCAQVGYSALPTTTPAPE